VDVVRRLGELRLLGHWFAVCITCDIDASEIAVGIDEYIDLKTARTIGKVECHGEDASTALTCRHQRFQTIVLLHFEVVAVAAAIADSSECSSIEMFKKFLASRELLSGCYELCPLTG